MPRPVPRDTTVAETDVAVVGAGAAGLYTALVAAEQGARVLLVSRSPLPQSASYWAQGGLAAALARDDEPQLHLEDTLRAGRGATRESAARILCDEAPARVRELERRAVAFDRTAEGTLKLSLEGGHSRRRVVHAGGSATGRQVTRALSSLAGENDAVDVRERSAAHALWTHEGRCMGVTADFGPVRARATVLATGGAAALWQRTTNPSGALGAGLELAHGAGAVLADLELLQFHPTALVMDGPMDGFLITEAVRGEGARLLDAAGERFVDELAPRDEVARAIHDRTASQGRRPSSVFLDMREVGVEGFPNIVEALSRAGLDARRDLIPVAPAAHYTIGGVATDRHGRSTVPGLYAVGECASTGVHGANRLASNSLSECFVFGRRAAIAATDEPSPAAVSPPAGFEPFAAIQNATRAALWAHAGMVRDAPGLTRLCEDAHPLARMIARSALERRETRGCHVRADFPATDPTYDGRHIEVSEDESLAIREWR